MKKNRLLSPFFCSIPCFYALLAMPLLFAGEPLMLAGYSEEDFLGEIPVVLTATRLAQPITEAPAAITIIDQEMIHASGARQIADLFRLVPGFVVSHDSGHAPIVTYHEPSSEYVPRLQVLIDGRSVYSPVFGSVDWINLPLAIDDIERIEVIRGPNAASYGSNSFLAIVNIITQHASETTGTYLHAISGSNGAKDGYASYGNTTGDLDYRVSASINNDHGFADRADDHHMKKANFRSDYQLNANDSVMFQAGLTDGRREDDSKSLQAVKNRDININFEQIQWRRQLSNKDSFSLQFFHTIEDLRQRFDVNISEYKGITLPTPVHIIRDSSNYSERFDLELQHTKLLTDNIRLIWGLGMRQDGARALQIFGTDPATGYTGNKTTFYNQMGRLFSNVEWRTKQNITLNLGASLEKSDLAESDFSPRLGINYLITPEQSVRFIASRATRTPSLNEEKSNFRIPVENFPLPPFNFVSTLWRGNENVKPERITSLELAYHANIVKKKLSFDLKLYREELRDLISAEGNYVANPADPLFNQYSVFDNLTDANIRGVETNLDFIPQNNTRVVFSHSYAEIDSENPNISSEKLATSAPQNITSILAIHHFPGDITGSVLLYRVTSSNGLGSGTPIPGYEHINFRIALPINWLGGHGEVAFVVQNAKGNYTDWRPDNTAEPQEYISITTQWD